MTLPDTTRRRRGALVAVLALAGAMALVGAMVLPAAATASGTGPEDDLAGEFDERERGRIIRLSPLGDPPPSTNAWADHPGAAALGQFLFFDERLSANGEVSCATCHDSTLGFADGKPLAEGLGAGTRHTPALWNLAYNRWFFWDGRTDSLWSQALRPMESEVELGSNRMRLARLVHDDTDLRRAYEGIFGPLPALEDTTRFPLDARPVPTQPAHPDHRSWTSMAPEDQRAVTTVFVNLGKAIAAHERRLLSRRSPFDVFVEGLRTGDTAAQAALSPSARRGLKLFIGRGECRLCHSGPNLTDGEFHDIRVPPLHSGPPRDAARFEGLRRLQADPFNAAGEYSDDRKGPAAQRLEFAVNGPQNWGRFKTPSLRNVALSPPYMHQGQFETLADVLEYYSTLENAVVMDHHDETILVPRDFSDEEKADLIAFLESLTDDSLDPALRRRPASPFPRAAPR